MTERLFIMLLLVSAVSLLVALFVFPLFIYHLNGALKNSVKGQVNDSDLWQHATLLVWSYYFNEKGNYHRCKAITFFKASAWSMPIALIAGNIMKLIAQ